MPTGAIMADTGMGCVMTWLRQAFAAWRWQRLTLRQRLYVGMMERVNGRGLR